MKVIVDELRCDAHGQCVRACPEVFALGEDDDVVKLLVKEPDERFREAVRKAVRVCPKAAIRIED